MILRPYLLYFELFNLMLAAAALKRWSPKITPLRNNNTCPSFLEFAYFGNGSVSCVSDRPILMDAYFKSVTETPPFTIYPEYKLCNHSNDLTRNRSSKYFESVLRISGTIINNVILKSLNINIDCKNDDKVVAIQVGFLPLDNEYVFRDTTRSALGLEPAKFNSWPYMSRQKSSRTISQCVVNTTLQWNTNSKDYLCITKGLSSTPLLAEFVECKDLQTCRFYINSKLLQGKCNLNQEFLQHCIENPSKCQPEQFSGVGSGILYCNHNHNVARIPFFKYPESIKPHSRVLWHLFKDDNAILQKFVQLEFNPNSLNSSTMTFLCYAPKFLAIPGFTWYAVVTKSGGGVDFVCQSSNHNTEYIVGEACTFSRPTNVECQNPCNFEVICGVYFQNGIEYKSNPENCKFLNKTCSTNPTITPPDEITIRAKLNNSTTPVLLSPTISPTFKGRKTSQPPPYHYTVVTHTIINSTNTVGVQTNHSDSDNKNAHSSYTASYTDDSFLSASSLVTARSNTIGSDNFLTNQTENAGTNLISPSTTESSTGNRKNEGGYPLALISAIVMGVMLLILLPVLLRFYWKSKQRKRELVSSEEIRHFLEGAIQINNSTNSNDQTAMVVPYDVKLEIPRRKITLETKVLGKGNFGKVVQGYIGERSVAVKMLDKSVDAKYFRAILSELKIMSFVGKHENIVELVGAITDKIRNRDVYVILEFCHNGNALDYVRARREVFLDLITESAMAPGFSKSMQRETLQYENFNTKRLSSRDLIRWSMEIAAGMDFVTSKNVCHGDLAARNILLSNHLVAKVGDFGLAKQLTEYSLYVQKKECPLPLKWMSIESLRDLEFSIQSDVWSYGITLWELFSLGCTPYPGMDWNFQAWKTLLEGQRMDRAEFASPEIHDILLKCWETKPNARPQFSSLQEMFAAELEKVTSRICQRKMLSVNLDFTHNI